MRRRRCRVRLRLTLARNVVARRRPPCRVTNPGDWRRLRRGLRSSKPG
jgi:hypothetical protein